MPFVNMKGQEIEVNGRKHTFWVHDKDRDAFLVPSQHSTPRESYYVYELHWKNYVIFFGGYEKLTQGEGKKFNIHYELGHMNIPEALSEHRNKIWKLAEEALKEYGFAGSKEDADKITFTYSPQLMKQLGINT